MILKDEGAALLLKTSVIYLIYSYWSKRDAKVDLISRFFQEDEEMLILTDSDELNRTYVENNRLHCDTTTTRTNTSCDDTRTNRPFLTEEDNPIMRDGSTLWQDSPAFNETRATVISSGPSTISITSVVPTPDHLCFKNNRSYGKERRSSELGRNGETKLSCKQNQGNKRRSCLLAGLLEDNLQNQRIFEDEGEEKVRGEAVEGTSQRCYRQEEERTRMNNPVQNRNTGSRGLNPPVTITAWEAGWNVTNAIQVRNLFYSVEKGRKIDIGISSW